MGNTRIGLISLNARTMRIVQAIGMSRRVVEQKDNSTLDSVEKILTLPSCSETTPPLVLGSGSASVPVPAFASETIFFF